MKKTFILALGALAALGMQASDIPTQVLGMYDDMPLMYGSPDGTWGFGTYGDSSVTIYNFATGEQWYTDAYTDDREYYSPGCGGNIVSNDGKFLMSFDNSTKSDFYYVVVDPDGGTLVPVALPKGNQVMGGWTNGISANGKFITGLAYANRNVLVDAPDNVPVMWDWDDAAGAYGPMQVLPYPTIDLWGREIKQGSYALDVSDDGLTVTVLTTDSFGGFSTELGICRRSEVGGEWHFEWVGAAVSYIPDAKLPDRFTAHYPTKEEYMTEDELEAWNQAEQQWVEDGRPAGQYPQAVDYMTPENAEAYLQAKDDYQEALNKYNAEAQAFNDLLEQEIAAGRLAEFEINGARMSANGRWMIATSVNDRMSIAGNSVIYLFDLDNDTWKTIKPERPTGVYALSVSNDGLVTFVDFAWYELVQNTYIYLPDTETIMPIQDWVKEKNPTAYAFMEDEMIHTFYGYQAIWVEDEYESGWIFPEGDFVDAWVTGQLRLTPDREMLFGFSYNYWNDGSDGSIAPVAYNYVITDGGFAKLPVTSVAPDNASTAPVELFDLQGRRVASPRSGAIYIKRQGTETSKVIWQ